MKIAKILIVVVALIIIVYFALNYYVSRQMHNNSMKSWESMKNSEFECPEGTEEKIDRWSKLGYMRYCVNMKDGKWEAWSDGYKNVDGNYHNGKEHGKWIWYRKDGSISRIKEYKNGIEISDKMFKDN